MATGGVEGSVRDDTKEQSEEEENEKTPSFPRRGVEAVGSYLTFQLLRAHTHTQDHPYAANIAEVLPGPCPPVKRLEDFSLEEVASFPEIVKVPHL